MNIKLRFPCQARNDKRGQNRLLTRASKLEANKERDSLHQRQLGDLGWRVLVVWECEMIYTERVSTIVRNFLCEEKGEK
jgi:G:T-mismatch repair DNA endonuclease (very short patch repair protein)